MKYELQLVVLEKFQMLKTTLNKTTHIVNWRRKLETSESEYKVNLGKTYFYKLRRKQFNITIWIT